MTKALDLTTLMSTRLCHDITGPISAINNGVELLEEMSDDPTMQQEAMKLIISSAKEATHRLQFYRLAFGHLSSSENASLLTRQDVIEQFFATTKTQIAFADALPSITPAMIRLCFNLLIIASQSLIRGGNIAISSREAGAIELLATGPNVRLNPSFIEVLNGNTEISASDPKTIHLSFIMQLLAQASASLSVSLQEDEACKFIVTPIPDESI